MSWFDEAVARKQREQRTEESRQGRREPESGNVTLRQQQEVEALNPLLERLLSEYGERVFGRSFLQKRFIVRLERPGKSLEKSWNWHWHLDSLVKDLSSVEVNPVFASDGMIRGLLFTSAQKRMEAAGADEDAIKEVLVALYLQ